MPIVSKLKTEIVKLIDFNKNIKVHFDPSIFKKQRE